MKESVVARWYFVMVVIVVGMLGCTPSVRQTPTATAPPPLAECPPFKEAAVQEIGPFNYEHRLTIYQKINQLTQRLLSCRPRRTLAERNVPALEPAPILTLVDLDGDGLADAYTQRDTAGKPSRDKGVIFDLNRDGKADYVVFIGGFVLTQQRQPKLMTYHMIDSNKDGRIDIVVYNVDLDGDGFLDDDVSAWLYDRNFDGRLDEGEYLGLGFQQPIPQTAQGFAIKTWGKETLLSTQEPVLEGLTLVLREINQAH